MSIYDPVEKINPVKDREGSQRPSVFNGVKQFVNLIIQNEKGIDIIIVIIVILVGLGSFELGRLSKGNIAASGIKIEYPNIVSATNTTPKISLYIKNNDKNFFASNRGSKYYSIGCSTGKNIKQENRIYFTTREEAEKAGYSISSACR